MNITHAVRELTKLEGMVVEVLITNAVNMDGNVDELTSKATITGELHYNPKHENWGVVARENSDTVHFHGSDVDAIETRHNRYTKITVVWA